jgi:hypothetical protein
LERHNWPGNVRELKSVLSSLHTHFGRDDITEETLQLVFVLLGHGAPQLTSQGKPFEVHELRAECLGHLLRADEVLRASKLAVRPLLLKPPKGRPAAPLPVIKADVEQSLHELDLLCLRPLLFHTEHTYRAIYRFKGQLSELYSSSLGSAKKGKRFWDANVSPAYQQATSILFKEMKRLMAGR